MFIGGGSLINLPLGSGAGCLVQSILLILYALLFPQSRLLCLQKEI